MKSFVSFASFICFVVVVVKLNVLATLVQSLSF